MSKFQFVESQSTDPVERQIAERVSAILQNPALNRVQREAQVRQAQRDLIGYRRARGSRSRLIELARAVRVEKGSVPASVQVAAGRLQIGVIHPQRGLAWVDAGSAPPEFGREVPATALPRSAEGGRERRAVVDPIAARRRELGQAPTR